MGTSGINQPISNKPTNFSGIKIKNMLGIFVRLIKIHVPHLTVKNSCKRMAKNEGLGYLT
jgi:hypothetical protein